MQASALLLAPRTRRIRVPDVLELADLVKWERFSSQDSRLGRALSAGRSDGWVVQHLSGGPDLVTAYLAGPGGPFDHGEHALLTAALDARRLGHRGPLDERLLADAGRMSGAAAPRHRGRLGPAGVGRRQHGQPERHIPCTAGAHPCLHPPRRSGRDTNPPTTCFSTPGRAAFRNLAHRPCGQPSSLTPPVPKISSPSPRTPGCATSTRSRFGSCAEPSTRDTLRQPAPWRCVSIAIRTPMASVAFGSPTTLSWTVATISTRCLTCWPTPARLQPYAPSLPVPT